MGAGEVLSEVVGLKQLHAEVKRAEAEVEAKAKAEAEAEAAQPPTPEVPAKKPMSKKDKVRLVFSGRSFRSRDTRVVGFLS